MTDSLKYTRLLTIDSSGSTLGVGVSRGETLTEQTSSDRFRHAEYIFNLIDRALKDAGLRKGDLEGVVVSTGPGSFTGLRVGLAAAKGLSLALAIPIVGIPTYEAIAGPLYESCGRAMILIPSGRGEYYVYDSCGQTFDANNIAVRKTNEIASLSQMAPIFMADRDFRDMGLKNIAIIDPEVFVMSSRYYIMAGRKRLVQSGGDDIDRLVPLYIQTFPVRRKQ